jgi:hypothetical protein
MGLEKAATSPASLTSTTMSWNKDFQALDRRRAVVFECYAWLTLDEPCCRRDRRSRRRRECACRLLEARQRCGKVRAIATKPYRPNAWRSQTGLVAVLLVDGFRDARAVAL